MLVRCGAQEDTQVAISQQVGLVAQLKHIVSELSSRRPAAQKTMLLQAMLAENGTPVNYMLVTLFPCWRWSASHSRAKVALELHLDEQNVCKFVCR